MEDWIERNSGLSDLELKLVRYSWTCLNYLTIIVIRISDRIIERCNSLFSFTKQAFNIWRCEKKILACNDVLNGEFKEIITKREEQIIHKVDKLLIAWKEDSKRRI